MAAVGAASPVTALQSLSGVHFSGFSSAKRDAVVAPEYMAKGWSYEACSVVAASRAGSEQKRHET